MVSVAGANTSAPPSPTMTVWVWGLANVVVVVAPDIVVVDVAWGRVVVDVGRRTVVVVIASAHRSPAGLQEAPVLHRRLGDLGDAMKVGLVTVKRPAGTLRGGRRARGG